MFSLAEEKIRTPAKRGRGRGRGRGTPSSGGRRGRSPRGGASASEGPGAEDEPIESPKRTRSSPRSAASTPKSPRGRRGRSAAAKEEEQQAEDVIEIPDEPVAKEQEEKGTDDEHDKEDISKETQEEKNAQEKLLEGKSTKEIKEAGKTTEELPTPGEKTPEKTEAEEQTRKEKQEEGKASEELKDEDATPKETQGDRAAAEDQSDKADKPTKDVTATEKMEEEEEEEKAEVASPHKSLKRKHGDIEDQEDPTTVVSPKKQKTTETYETVPVVESKLLEEEPEQMDTTEGSVEADVCSMPTTDKQPQTITPSAVSPTVATKELSTEEKLKKDTPEDNSSSLMEDSSEKQPVIESVTQSLSEDTPLAKETETDTAMPPVTETHVKIDIVDGIDKPDKISDEPSEPIGSSLHAKMDSDEADSKDNLEDISDEPNEPVVSTLQPHQQPQLSVDGASLKDDTSTSVPGDSLPSLPTGEKQASTGSTDDCKPESTEPDIKEYVVIDMKDIPPPESPQVQESLPKALQPESAAAPLVENQPEMPTETQEVEMVSPPITERTSNQISNAHTTNNVDTLNGDSECSDLLFQRKFITNQMLNTHSLSSGKTFTVVSYNILADCHAQRDIDSYSWNTPEHMSLEYRHSRLVQELKYLDGDIVCLQEVGPEYFSGILMPALKM